MGKGIFDVPGGAPGGAQGLLSMGNIGHIMVLLITRL